MLFMDNIMHATTTGTHRLQMESSQKSNFLT